MFARIVLGALAVLVTACGAPSTPPRQDAVCPTIPREARDGFLVHGARLFDGERELPPTDVLVANGEIVAVGPAICFRAVGGAIAFVDGGGATLLPDGEFAKIEPGMAANLTLVEGGEPIVSGPMEGRKIRAMWRRGVLQSAVKR